MLDFLGKNLFHLGETTYIHHIKKCLWERIRCLFALRSANHRLRLFRLSVIFRLLFGFELLHYVRCILFGGNLIWLGIYRTYWRDRVAVVTLVLRPGMCSGGRTQAFTPSFAPGGRMHRQNTVHKYRTTSRAQATANPITEPLVGQSSNKCSSTASASFQSNLVTLVSFPEILNHNFVVHNCSLKDFENKR